MTDNTSIDDEAIERAIAAQDYEDCRAEARERLGFQIEYSQAALKNLQLVNGGAIIGLLTFFGNTGVVFDQDLLRWSLGLFGAGLVSSLMAYFGAYFSQACFMEYTLIDGWNAQRRAIGKPPRHQHGNEFRTGNRYLYGGIAASALSLIFFIVGTFVALNSFG